MALENTLTAGREQKVFYLLTKYLHLLLPLRSNPIKGHHPNLTWLSPCCLHLCSVFAGYLYFSVAHSVPPAVWPSPAVAWYLSQQIFATPRSCYIGDVKPSIRYSKDVLLWINWLTQPRKLWCDLIEVSIQRSPRAFGTAEGCDVTTSYKQTLFFAFRSSLQLH